MQRGYIEVYMNGSDGERRLVNSFESRMSLKGLSAMISYPDSRAYKMKVRICDDAGGKQYGITVDLKSSQDQNMAYYVSPDLKPITFSEISEPDEGKIPEEINAVEHTPNKLRVSQINNPFVFPQEFTYIFYRNRNLSIRVADKFDIIVIFQAFSRHDDLAPEFR